jgi:hypothetical protein
MKILPRFKLLLVMMYVISFCVAASEPDLRTVDMQQDWGIIPVHIRVTAAGYMIEFRYRVIDTEKALILSSRKLADFPYLKVQKSNAKLSVPYGSTVGFLKSNRRFLKEGKNYTAMFSNEGQHLIAGDKVNIQIKDQLSQEITLR